MSTPNHPKTGWNDRKLIWQSKVLCKDVSVSRKNWKELCLADVSIKISKNGVHSSEMKSNPKKSWWAD